MEWHIIIKDVVKILFHEGHSTGEPVLLVVSAVVHVRVITSDDIKKYHNLCNNVLWKKICCEKSKAPEYSLESKIKSITLN